MLEISSSLSGHYLGVLLVCLSPEVEAGRGPWADDSLLPIILVSFEGTGRSEIEVMVESWAGVRVCTSSCLALNTSSSSSTLTFVTSFVSRMLRGSVE